MTIHRTTVDTKDAAIYLGVSVDYMKRARVSGKGAAFIRIGRKIVYRISDLDNFLNQNTFTNLSKVA